MYLIFGIARNKYYTICGCTLYCIISALRLKLLVIKKLKLFTWVKLSYYCHLSLEAVIERNSMYQVLFLSPVDREDCLRTKFEELGQNLSYLTPGFSDYVSSTEFSWQASLECCILHGMELLPFVSVETREKYSGRYAV